MQHKIQRDRNIRLWDITFFEREGEYPKYAKHTSDKISKKETVNRREPKLKIAEKIISELKKDMCLQALTSDQLMQD